MFHSCILYSLINLLEIQMIVLMIWKVLSPGNQNFETQSATLYSTVLHVMTIKIITAITICDDIRITTAISIRLQNMRILKVSLYWLINYLINFENYISCEIDIFVK